MTLLIERDKKNSGYSGWKPCFIPDSKSSQVKKFGCFKTLVYALACAVLLIVSTDASAHTNSVGFAVSPGTVSGKFNVEIFFGSWHSGTLAAQGNLSLFTLKIGGNSTLAADYTVEAYGNGGAIVSQSFPFTRATTSTAITLQNENASNNYTDAQITAAGFILGSTYFWGGSTALVNNKAAASRPIYNHQSAVILNVTPGTYKADYDLPKPTSATWSQKPVVANMIFTITSSGTVAVAGAAKPINKSGNEDVLISFTDADFTAAFTGGGTLGNVKITTLVTHGTLFVDANGNSTADTGETVTLNQQLNATQRGQLRYMPVLNFAGNDVFKWDGFDQTASSFSGTPANANITITPVNDPPVLGGTFTTASTINDNATIQPFSGVTVSDVDSTNVSVHITFTAANGTLSGTGVTGSNGNYTITSAVPAIATTNLQGVIFTPATNLVASTTLTTFTLTPNDGIVNGTANATSKVTVKVLARINSNFSLDTGTHNSRILSIAGGSGTFTYATADPAIVTVSSTGKITVVGTGSAMITLTDTVRNTTATVLVTVTLPLTLSPTSVAVDGNGAATITPTGGSSTNTAAVTSSPGVATGTVTINADGSFTFTAPTTGAFAGDYIITVTDTVSGFSKTVTVSVPMQVSISSLNIAESDTAQTITVSGMANSDVIRFNIKDANGVSDTGVNAIAADIADSTPTSNQVVKTITPANVNVITPFTITATNTSNTTLAALTTKRMHIVPENSIAISVNNASTGIAVAGVTLKLRNPAPHIKAASKLLTTNASGVVSATLPIVGKYVYTVFKQGFSPVTAIISVTATGTLTKPITLRPIAAPLTFTGSLSTVTGVDFTAPNSLPTVIAVDANGNQVFATVTATTATTATFSLVIDSNDFIPVAFIAKHPATRSGRIIITTSLLAAGGNAGAFPVLNKRNVNISVVELAKANVKKADFTSKLVNSATLTKPAGVTTIDLAAEALPGTREAFATTANLRQPTDPLVELMKDANGNILSAPVKHPPSTVRTVLGTKAVVLGGGSVSAVTDAKMNATVSVQLPADAFRINDPLTTLTPGDGTALFVTFSTVNTSNTQAKFSAQKAIEVDLVLIDAVTRKVLSTLSGNHNLNRVRVSIPVDPNALASFGIAPAGVETAFTAGTLQINTAQTIAEFDAGITTVITGPFAYDQLTGNISFFTSHFSVFGLGGGTVGGTGGGTTLLAGGGGCALSGVDTPFDPLLPTLALLAAGWLWGRRKLKVER